MDANTKSASSVIQTRLDRLEKSLTFLGEAVDRITMKTSDVRLSLPYPCTDEARTEEAMSPLAFRLKEFENFIERQTNTLNLAASEIEL